MANQVARAEGRIADLQPTGGVTGLSDADWDRMIRTHLYGAFYGTRAALRHMIPARAGNIINISSVLGQQPEAGPVDYSSAKAGIIALTKSASREVAGLGVRINAVCPGYVDTPLLDELGDLVKYAVTLDIGMGRMAKASELAELVRFLAGPESSYCNGDVFTASGAYR
jgi:NAD(P)-dependent dehydrogenase (short-subunit alcohol dehydrogenase family)